MQNFNSINKQNSQLHNLAHRGQQDFQKIFHRLKDLHQVQDESRNQLCPVFFDQQSQIRSRRQSTWSTNQGPNHTNILKQLEQTSQPPLGSHYENRIPKKKSSYNYLQDQDLRDSNRKLQEDNKKLFNQCIRLKKICKNYECNEETFKKKITKEETNNFYLQLENQNMSLKQQLTELRLQNISLQQKLASISSLNISQEKITQKYEKMKLQMGQTSRLNDELNKKIQFLEKQLQSAKSRCGSKSSQSISMNNSTQQSRKTETEKDRMITNMKIVHQSEKLKLKNTIEGLKQELNKQLNKNGQKSSFSNLVNHNIK